MVNRNMDVMLTDEEFEFLKWLAERDKVTVKQEMRCLFNLQLREEMELYNEERLLEQRENVIRRVRGAEREEA